MVKGREYRDCQENPIKDGFYVGEHYKGIFYVFKSNHPDLEWEVQSWGGFSPDYGHYFSTFEPIEDPKAFAKRLMVEGTSASIKDAEFIERKLEELRNPPKKKEISCLGAAPYDIEEGWDPMWWQAP